MALGLGVLATRAVDAELEVAGRAGRDGERCFTGAVVHHAGINGLAVGGYAEAADCDR